MLEQSAEAGSQSCSTSLPTAGCIIMLDQPARLRPLYDFEPRQHSLSPLDRAQCAPAGLEVNWTDGLELLTECRWGSATMLLQVSRAVRSRTHWDDRAG